MTMKKIPLLTAVAWLVVSLSAAAAAPDGDAVEVIDIPYTRFVLDNGLTLIVHEDPKAPIVAVNVWYHVGSKNEKPGKTGFAHLFEHLMFEGTENCPEDFSTAFDTVGATGQNGTTNFDRTNYFENVPTSALDVALWLESDRMGHLLGAIDQEKLDAQRGVVQNEKRQGENQPYGKTMQMIYEATYPHGHPYSWSVIGSLEDLDAATLEDVHEWFKTYYGAANAVLSIAGDVDTETVRSQVEAYFGDIPSGPPVARQEAWIAQRTGTHRQSLEDRVPQARIYKVWNIPEGISPDSDTLDLVAGVLADGKSSRLFKRLVYDEQIATDVVGFALPREIGGLFVLWATAQPGGDLAEVERALDEELARFLADGPTPQELERVKTDRRARFIRGVERIGGFGGKSDILAQSEVYGGSPDYHKVTQRRIATATAADLQQAAQRWLSDGVFILEVRPFPEYGTVESSVDRSQLPEPGEPPEVSFPELQRTTLANGLEVILAERHAIPVVYFNLLLDAGYAADQFGIRGTARLALDMLDEGTTSRTALEISDELARLGATLGAGSNPDMSAVFLSALKENLTASLELYADVVLNPAFPAEDFERLKRQQQVAIQREQANPMGMAVRVFPALLYGDDHAYGMPLSGSGTQASVASLDREEMQKFHRTWFKPNHAMLVVVGDTTLGEITPQLEKLFRAWKPGDIPEKNIAPVEHQTQSSVYLLDRPGSIQSIIFAAHLAPPKANPHEIAIEVMNEIFGGGFSSRLNLNLREDKHWAYGAGSFVLDSQGQRPFIAFSPVQADKTKEAMMEIQREFEQIRAERPPTAEELATAQAQHSLSLPGRWETARAVGRSVTELVRFGLPDDFWATYAERVRSLTVADVSQAAAEVLRPEGILWVVVGDRAKIEDGVRELGFGEIRYVDADGNLLEGNE